MAKMFARALAWAFWFLVRAAVHASDLTVAGYTTSPTPPGTAGGFQQMRTNEFPNNRNVFVSKFNSGGRALKWCTFLGGNGDDTPICELKGDVHCPAYCAL